MAGGIVSLSTGEILVGGIYGKDVNETHRCLSQTVNVNVTGVWAVLVIYGTMIGWVRVNKR